MYSNYRAVHHAVASMPYCNEWKDNYRIRSPQALIKAEARSLMCMEGALYAGVMLERVGVNDLCYLGIHREDKEGNQSGHCVCVYRVNDRYGCISVSNIDTLVSFLPRYETIEEVVEFYINAYHRAGFKPMFYGLFKGDDFVNALNKDWASTEDDLSELSDYILNNYQYEISYEPAN